MDWAAVRVGNCWFTEKEEAAVPAEMAAAVHFEQASVPHAKAIFRAGAEVTLLTFKVSLVAVVNVLFSM